MSDSATPWTVGCQVSLSLTISRSLPKFMSIASVMPSSHLILWCPLLLLPSIFSSITDFSSETFPVIQLFASGDQNTRASASASVLSMTIQNSFPLRLTGMISLLSKELSGVFSNNTVEGINSLAFCLLYGPTLTTLRDHWEDIALTIQTFVNRVISLLFNILSRFVIAFLPRSNHLLISWMESPFAVILEPKKRKSVATSPFLLLFAMK